VWLVRRSILATGVILLAVPSAFSQLRPEPDAIALAAPELVERLRADPIAYFRFVNRPWIARVCDVFADETRGLPIVRLHGDAHVEQFAVTEDAWGLDDFDDSARGPALVDVVRYLGSIDLVLRQRGWRRQRDALFDRFFAGYRRGLAQPGYRPPRPEIVGRLRAKSPRSRTAFLAWADAQMKAMSQESMDAVVAGTEAVSRIVYAERPDLAPGYMTVVRAGWLQMGVGSAAAPKVLIRLQGPSTEAEDDEFVEAKQVGDLEGLRCLQPAPAAEPALRVVIGTRQIGRLKPRILAAGPELTVPAVAARGRRLHDWWIHSWEPSYRELRASDLQAPADLAAVAYDSAVQLGAGSVKDDTGPHAAVLRKRELSALARLEPRIRKETSRLVDELLLGWKELAAR